jgi:hypothetical protein
MLRKTRVASLALIALASLPPRPASADLLGVRAGVYTHLSDAFVGVEGVLGVGHSIYLNPNVEYVFVNNATYMTFNGDVHYDFRTHSRAYVWAGGGLAVIYDNPSGPAPSHTDLGADFLVGAGLKGPVIPYVQAKFIAKNSPEFALAFGLRF